MPAYIGRFAPSPTGPLHAGSVVAALASWLDARAHGGQWLVRMEDVDAPRCSAEHANEILRQLGALQLHSDGPVMHQAPRSALYAQALDRLLTLGHAYPCACSRTDIDTALAAQGQTHSRHSERVYPGTCRQGLQGRSARAWRFKLGEPGTSDAPLHWQDRRLGAQQQHLARSVGDFVLLRADGYFAYQLAVVIDDAAQGITHVVRGEDLADNTPRQIALQRALGLPTPIYLHTPLVLGPQGNKLSKQNGAVAVDVSAPLAALRQAAAHLGLHPAGDSVSALLADATRQWAARWMN